MVEKSYINKAVAIKRRIVQNYSQYKYDREINKLVDYIINIDEISLKEHYNVSNFFKEDLGLTLTNISQKINNKVPMLDKQIANAYNLFAFILLCDITVEKEEIIVGKGRWRPYDKYPKGLREEVEKLIQDNMISAEEGKKIIDAWDMRLLFRASGGHVVPGYDRILKKGYSEILKQINDNQDINKNYKTAARIAIFSAQKLILRYSYEARKEGMLEVANRCERIAFEKPEGFLDALQLLWLQHEVMLSEGDIQGISLGRVDQYLYPYYKEDIQKGKVSENQVVLAINEFWKKFCFHRNTFSFQNITLGGLKSELEDGSNELTLYCMDAQIATSANQPMLSLRINDKTPKKVWDKAMEVIGTGMGVPALFNDSVAIEAQKYVGITDEDALDYSIVGCVELTAGGKEYSHTEGLRINLIKLLEIMIFGKDVKTGLKWELHEQKDINAINSDEIIEWYKTELHYLLEFLAEKLVLIEDSYGKYWPVPYLSVTMEGCVDKGVDVTRGGTKYNNTCINFAGIANLANSFIAIKYLLEDKGLSFEELKSVLLANYDGYEKLHEEIEKLPKYGNDIDSVDNITKMLVDFIVAELENKRNHRGGRFKAGFYTVHLHGWMGENTLATLDGRKDGKALASSLSPSQGSDISGPLAVFNSLTKMSHNKMSNGMVCDIKFSKTFFDNQQIDKIEHIIKTYFANGGMEVQLNVVNRETLLKAQRNPEEYKNLIVRVSGFSTYFVNLSKQLQDEIILRYENTCV